MMTNEQIESQEIKKLVHDLSVITNNFLTEKSISGMKDGVAAYIIQTACISFTSKTISKILSSVDDEKVKKKIISDTKEFFNKSLDIFVK